MQPANNLSYWFSIVICWFFIVNWTLPIVKETNCLFLFINQVTQTIDRLSLLTYFEFSLVNNYFFTVAWSCQLFIMGACKKTLTKQIKLSLTLKIVSLLLFSAYGDTLMTYQMGLKLDQKQKMSLPLVIKKWTSTLPLNISFING